MAKTTVVVKAVLAQAVAVVVAVKDRTKAHVPVSGDIAEVKAMLRVVLHAVGKANLMLQQVLLASSSQALLQAVRAVAVAAAALQVPSVVRVESLRKHARTGLQSAKNIRR